MPATAEAWRVVLCNACGYGRVAASLTPPAVAAFYQVDYYTHTGADPTSTRGSLLERLRTHAA